MQPIEMEHGDAIGFSVTKTGVCARGRHTCCECRQSISFGEPHEVTSGVSDGSWFRERSCAGCANIRRAFCSSWVFGELWDAVAEAADEIDSDAVSRLDHLGRAKLHLWTMKTGRAPQVEVILGSIADAQMKDLRAALRRGAELEAALSAGGS